jgi:hypothetical protein
MKYLRTAYFLIASRSSRVKVMSFNSTRTLQLLSNVEENLREPSPPQLQTYVIHATLAGTNIRIL